MEAAPRGPETVQVRIERDALEAWKRAYCRAAPRATRPATARPSVLPSPAATDLEAARYAAARSALDFVLHAFKGGHVDPQAALAGDIEITEQDGPSGRRELVVRIGDGYLHLSL